MGFRGKAFYFSVAAVALLSLSVMAQAQEPASSKSAKPAKKSEAGGGSVLDAGTVSNNVYRNKTLALSCKIPPGWVLRNDEMNASGKGQQQTIQQPTSDKAPATPPVPATSSAAGKVLLAAFSRPPEARAEDVNSSILIAAEPASAYPGLKDAAQYFGPLSEVAVAQGFTQDEDPYEIAVGTKTLARADFHKDVGSRVMHQSTLAMLAHGYAVSITLIAGTEDEVEELIDGLSFSPNGK